MASINVEKTVYDEPEPSDGKRVLVMRTWPRGIRKDKVDVWLKDLGTPKELIKRWKGGKVSWDAFSREYVASLKGKEGLLKSLAKESRLGTITLLCGCRDKGRCHRTLLKSELEKLV